MADMPRPRKDPSEWAAFPPAGDEPKTEPERSVGDTQPLEIPLPAETRPPTADLPRPHRDPAEWAVFPSAGVQDAAPPPTGKQRYVSDTQPMDIPPEAYRDAYTEDPGYGNDYTSDMGVPDGYDPYDPPRRRKGTRRRSADYAQEAPRRARTVRRRKHRSSCLGRLVRMVLILAAVMFALYSVISYALISKLKNVPRAPRTVTTGSLGTAHYTRSVLLIATDSRDVTQERGSSDIMILMTFNDASHEICFSSFLRDTYVDIPNRGYDRLSSAYAYGGAELLMDTLEWNYDVSIDDYICLSFASAASIIDSFGGVELQLTDEEAQAINEILQGEVNSLMGDAQTDGLLPSGGDLLLTGKQALSYARSRYLGNNGNSERERVILEKLEESMKQRAVQAVPQLLSTAAPSVSTNMNKMELYKLSLRLPIACFYATRQQQIPADGTWTAVSYGGAPVLDNDVEANRRILKNTAFAMSRAPEE